MVPNGWYPGFASPASRAMVKAYLAKYGGSASSVNADVAEGYAVGQIAAQAAFATHGLDNKKIIAYLHSGVTLSSVQGPVKFDSLGENIAAKAFTFQWQHGKEVQILPPTDPNSVKPEFPKPSWNG
jgi:ABC-type branched-subunit amino acid transport system substrate-binding protein